MIDLRRKKAQEVNDLLVGRKFVTIDGDYKYHTFTASKTGSAGFVVSNAGGVATSGLEMSQSSQRLSWTREEVDSKLRCIMSSIHSKCVESAKEFGCDGNYVDGANIAGFVKVAQAMLAQGIV